MSLKKKKRRKLGRISDPLGENAVVSVEKKLI
jgi:hypothetical protein